MRLIDLLNNSSIASTIGAFFGALCAFLLVIINDWRRQRNKLTLICNEIKLVSNHTKKKIETVKRNRSAIRDNNQLFVAPILKFNPSLIRQLSAEVLDKFTPDQRQAIDAICYTMQSIDELLDSALKKAELIVKCEGIERNQLSDKLLIDYDDAIVNLNRLNEMCENYASKDYRLIVTKQYVRSEYEE